MTIYERAAAGMPIDMRTDEDYQTECVPEMQRSRTLCHRMNALEPYDPKVRDLLNELFEGRLPASSNILTPVQIDRGHAGLFLANLQEEIKRLYYIR